MSFHKRKEERRSVYESEIKGFRLGYCTACMGSGYYDTQINGKTPLCGSCEGSGRERTRPHCKTDVKSMVGQLFRADISEGISIVIYVQNTRQIICQINGRDGIKQEPRKRLNLQFDQFSHDTDWFFECDNGKQYELNMFEPVKSPA